MFSGMLPNFLRRTKHIEEDLQFYLGDNWREVTIQLYTIILI